MTKTELITEYIENNMHVALRSKREVARVVFNNNPHMFKDVEEARSVTRRVLGSFGVASTGNKPGIKYEELREALDAMEVFTDEKRNGPTVLARANNNILGLYDPHCPFQDQRSLETCINYGIDNSVNTVILGGDSFDFFNISRFSNTHDPATLLQELEECNKFLDMIRIAFPTQHIYFIKGNHEVRWEAYLKQHASLLLDINQFSFESFFRLIERKITLVENGSYIKSGRLNCYHGNEFGVRTALNPAHAILRKRHDDIVLGHFHKTDRAMGYNVAKERVMVNASACLCELNPAFMPVNNWNHGFIHTRTNGEDYELLNIMVKANGKTEY